MNAETFCEHFATFAETPGGVAKLRELILQLAVQGKLVPQDENAEPARELIAKIALRRSSEGTTQRRKPDRTQSDEFSHPQPYELPRNWCWAGFDQVATIASNLVPPRDFTDLPHVAPDNIEKGTGCLLPYKTVGEDAVRSANHRFFAGQILYSKIRPNLSKAVIVDFDGLCSADMYPLNSHIDAGYLLRYILSSTFLGMAVRNDTRVAMPKINQEELSRILVAVPPLAEQRRIVAKVDQLLGLCDELAARQEARRTARERLVVATLADLTSPRDTTDRTAPAQRLQTHFDTLFDTPTTIPHLRQTILQLAVQGKLVPQDTNDEPAKSLIDRIVKQKARLISDKYIRNSNSHTSRDAGIKTETLPWGWSWETLDVISEIGTGGTPPTGSKEFYSNGTVPWITSAATNCEFITHPETFITQHAVDTCRLKVYPAGSLVVALYGQGKTRGQVGQLMFDSTTNQACAVIRFFGDGLGIRDYIRLVFRKKYHELRDLAAGGAQPNLNGGMIRLMKVPLPPLAEQKRIVAKVTALLAWCDTLERQLQATETASTQLLAAAVQQLLSATHHQPV